jgi:hypothetical protein
MIESVDGGPLGGAEAIDPGASTINAKKRRWRTPCDVPELEIWERSLSTLEDVDSDGGPSDGC